MAGSEDQWKLLCVGSGYHVYRYVWDLSQKLFNHRWMFFHGMPNFLSSMGRTPWYRTTRCFCFMVQWHRIDLTFVGSSPSADTCGATDTCVCGVLLVFLRLAIAFERALFPGLPHRSLDCQLTFRGSEGSSNVVSVLYNMAEVVCQGRHLAIAHAHHMDG